jgi:hypothetical protein
MFRAPAETFSDKYDINAAVSAHSNSLPSLSNTLQALTESKLRNAQNVIQSQGTTLSGLPAHMTLKTISIPWMDMGMGANQMMLEVWTVKGDKWYGILFVAPADKFEQYYPIAQQMINSFQVLG